MALKDETWRFNPFTGSVAPKPITEYLIIGEVRESLFGIQCREGILKKSTQYITCKEVTNNDPNAPLYGQTYVEVDKTQAPSSTQFRVDYDELDLSLNQLSGFYNTALIEFNPDQNGKMVEVSYEGTGRIVGFLDEIKYATEDLVPPDDISFRVGGAGLFTHDSTGVDGVYGFIGGRPVKKIIIEVDVPSGSGAGQYDLSPFAIKSEDLVSINAHKVGTSFSETKFWFGAGHPATGSLADFAVQHVSIALNGTYPNQTLGMLTVATAALLSIENKYRVDIEFFTA